MDIPSDEENFTFSTVGLNDVSLAGLSPSSKMLKKTSYKDKKTAKHIVLARLTAKENKIRRIEATAGSAAAAEKRQTIAWDTALRRASGERVLDSIPKLQKTIKNKLKAKVRAGKKWQRRETAAEIRQRGQSTHYHAKSKGKDSADSAAGGGGGTKRSRQADSDGAGAPAAKRSRGGGGGRGGARGDRGGARGDRGGARGGRGGARGGRGGARGDRGGARGGRGGARGGRGGARGGRR